MPQLTVEEQGIFMDYKSSFSIKLNELRNTNGLSLSELGDKLNISGQAISLLEKGKRLPSFDVLMSISDYFNVSLDYLVGRKSKEKNYKNNSNFHHHDTPALRYCQEEKKFLKDIFSSRLREERKKNKLKTEDLGKIIGVSKSTIGHWETGYYIPTAEKLFDLAEYFDVSVDYLLGRTDIKNIFY